MESLSPLISRQTVLVKSNLAGIPVFTMVDIKISNNISKEIDSANRDILLEIQGGL